MNKPFLLLYGAIDTFSGYGARARDIAKVIIDSDKYDVKIISCRWGNCTQSFLQQDNPDHKQILDRILQTNQLPSKPDIYIMCSVPNEMQRVGNYNILITAGIETNICSPEWLQGMNNADLVLVSSEHSKKVFQQTSFEKIDNNTKQVLETIKCNVEIQTLFEGFNDKIYKKEETLNPSEVYKSISEIPENFCYGFFGHWLPGDLGADRKNVGVLVKTFLETFRNINNPPALILKTNSASTSIMDRDDILQKITKIKNIVSGKLPNIYLLHGELSDEEINEIYNHPKIKTFVSFTKGEGFGRPLLESSIYQKPIICPHYSGQADFLKKEFIQELPGQLTQIHPSAVVENMLIPQSQWFDVDVNKASMILLNSFKNYSKLLENARRQSYFSRTNFTLDKMGEKLLEVLDTKVIKRVEFKLPKLTKINKNN